MQRDHDGCRCRVHGRSGLGNLVAACEVLQTVAKVETRFKLMEFETNTGYKIEQVCRQMSVFQPRR